MKILTILAAVVGVLSLFANITLGYTTYSLNMQKNTLQERLNAQIVDFNDTMASLNNTKRILSKTSGELAVATEKISTLNTQLESAKISVESYRNRASKAELFVSRVQCRYLVNEKKASEATKNADLKTEISYVLEKSYIGNIQSSSFNTFWSNSKSAMFTAEWGKNTQSKVVLAWNMQDTLQSIFDVSSGCLMYVR